MNIYRLIIAVFSGLMLFAMLVGSLILGQATGAKPVEAAIPLASTGPAIVTIDGPLTGTVDIDYTFLATVNPVSATLPISYTWETTGQSPVTQVDALNNTVSFSWSTSATQMITVTATNEWGTVTATHSITTRQALVDMAVVVDVSGATEFESTCFGCWTKFDPPPDILANPYPTNGVFHPLNYDFNESGGGVAPEIFWPDQSSSTAGHPVCGALPASKTINGFNYLVHEAEFYARTFPFNGWEFDKRIVGQGFWVLQQAPSIENVSNHAYISAHPFVTYSQNDVANFPQIQGGTYNSDCFTNDGGTGTADGECWETKGLPETANNNVPYVEYDFTPDWTGDIHIWVRAIGGWQWSFEWDGQSPTAPSVPALAPYRTAFFWQIDEVPVHGGSYPWLGRKFLHDEVNTVAAMTGKDKWRWVKIADGFNTPAVVSGQQYTLKIYQGSTGFNLDKIIITNNPEGVVGSTVVDDGRSVLGVINDTDVVNAGTATNLDNVANNLDIANDVLSLFNGQGPDASDGSATREACNRCNPAYGQDITDPLTQCTCRKNANETGGGTSVFCTFPDQPVNQLTNDIFYDRAPLRQTKEAVKDFITHLNPNFDQLGLVAFSDTIVQPRVKLHCLRYAEMGHAGPGGIDKCFNPALDPITYSHVISAAEAHTVGVYATNIAEGMREGLEELGISVPGYNPNVQHGCSADTSAAGDKEACDHQGNALRVLILFATGSPTRWPGYPADPGDCPDDGVIQWQGVVGAGHQAYDCAIFYAQQAAANNVIVFIIGIGVGNYNLLKAMATGVDDMSTPDDPSDDIVYFADKGGKYFKAANPSDLDIIFEQIRTGGFGEELPPTPYIWSRSGSYQIPNSETLVIHMDNHEQNLYDIYLEQGGNTYLICSNVNTNSSGSTDPDPTCSLTAAGVPPGIYDLYSTVAGTTGPPIGTATHQLDLVAAVLPSPKFYLPIILKD